jgi:hypothetical protein
MPGKSAKYVEVRQLEGSAFIASSAAVTADRNSACVARFRILAAMTWTLTASAATGVLWHMLIAYGIFRANVGDVLGWRVGAGLAAGIAAGWFTVWSRGRRSGGEHFIDVLLTYYGAVLVYLGVGGVLMVVVGVRPLRDMMALPAGVLFAVWPATILGVILIPLCAFNRWAIWSVRVWERNRPAAAASVE